MLNFFTGLKTLQIVKAVIFDCDGTLVDSEYSHYLSWQHALQKLGSDLTLEDYCQYVGKSGVVIARTFAEKLGADCASQLLSEKRSYYLSLCSKGLPPIEPTVQLLKTLLQQKESLGLKIGVCSAAKKEEILVHLKHLGVVEALDVILSGQQDLSDYSDPEGVNKPKPYIYLHAMKLLGVFPAECVVIEDSAPGVKAAVDAGCFTIAVPNEFTRLQDLSHAHLRIDSFANLNIEQFFRLIDKSNSRLSTKITDFIEGRAVQKSYRDDLSLLAVPEPVRHRLLMT